MYEPSVHHPLGWCDLWWLSCTGEDQQFQAMQRLLQLGAEESLPWITRGYPPGP